MKVLYKSLNGEETEFVLYEYEKTHLVSNKFETPFMTLYFNVDDVLVIEQRALYIDIDTETLKSLEKSVSRGNK